MKKYKLCQSLFKLKVKGFQTYTLYTYINGHWSLLELNPEVGAKLVPLKGLPKSAMLPRSCGLNTARGGNL